MSRSSSKRREAVDQTKVNLRRETVLPRKHGPNGNRPEVDPDLDPRLEAQRNREGEARPDDSASLHEERTGVYRKTTLENGIRVVTDKMSEVRSVSIGIIIDASPRVETLEQAGVAHLVEHLMFQGTSSRDTAQIARQMDEGGGNIGAFTTRDYTCYFATVLDDYLTYALDLLGDILLNSIFPDEHLEREKQAVLREIDASRDRPEERLHALFMAHAWPNHPLGRSIIGTPESVTALTREDLIYFVHQYYSPDSVIVSAAGNVEHEDFVAQVRDAFWRMLGTRQRKIVSTPEFRAGVTVEHMPVSQAYFSIGLPTLPYADPNRYALHLLSYVLGGGISSRLYRRLREERGLVYNVGCAYQAYGDAGVLVVEGSTTPEYLNQVLTLSLTELEGFFVGEDPIGEQELWKAKMQIRGQHLISGESTSTRMSRLATQEFYFGRHIPGDEILGKIEAVDAHAMQRLTHQDLPAVHESARVTVVGPEVPQHYGASSVGALLAGLRRTKEGR